VTQGKKSFDISNRRVISVRDVEDAVADGAGSLIVAQSAVITPSARDFLQQRGIQVARNGVDGGKNAKANNSSAAAQGHHVMQSHHDTQGHQGPGRSKSPDPALFSTPEAEVIKAEICAVGRKLWMRQFVDGNGGNISYRIGPNEVICTPTLVSKFDLTPGDLCLVDLEGNQIAGTKPRTSEIFLHLEIYKAVPEAKAAVHCHPPHATAYAITGRVPPNLVIPEFEVFIGKVAISPYETPGTEAFAQTVLPFVKQHNTVLLSNHGIVCWADTITHAEWYAEVLETYCWTLMLAAQLGSPISYISEQKGSDLLAIKKRLGLPDVRFDPSRMQECQLSELEMPGSIALQPCPCDGGKQGISQTDVDALVKYVTDAVMHEMAVG
jgi:L-fuculose-phosphate aldolase